MYVVDMGIAMTRTKASNPWGNGKSLSPYAFVGFRNGHLLPLFFPVVYSWRLLTYRDLRWTKPPTHTPTPVLYTVKTLTFQVIAVVSTVPSMCTAHLTPSFLMCPFFIFLPPLVPGPS